MDNKLLFFFLASLGLSHPVVGQNATTVPVGAIKITIPAGTGSLRKLTVISLPLSSRANVTGQVVGRITGLTANTITNSSAGWTTGQLSQQNAPKIFRITSGNATGLSFLISSTVNNTSTTLTIHQDDAASVNLTTLGIVTGASNGDTYEILDADTILSVFGTPADGVQGGSVPDSADQVALLSGGVWGKYYYNTTVNKWRSVGSEVDSDHVVIRPNALAVFLRIASTAYELTVTGDVPSVNRRVSISGNQLTDYSTYWPVDRTLGSMGISSIPGWVKSSNPNLADKVSFLDGGKWRKYYHDNTQWLAVGSNVPANSVVIPYGSGVILNKSAGNAIANESVPYSLQ